MGSVHPGRKINDFGLFYNVSIKCEFLGTVPGPVHESDYCHFYCTSSGCVLDNHVPTILTFHDRVPSNVPSPWICDAVRVLSVTLGNLQA